MCRYVCILNECDHVYVLGPVKCPHRKPAPPGFPQRKVDGEWCKGHEFDEPRWIWDRRYDCLCFGCAVTQFSQSETGLFDEHLEMVEEAWKARIGVA
jgi:hypothetical protein